MRKKYYFTKKYLKECQFSKLLFYFFSASYHRLPPSQPSADKSVFYGKYATTQKKSQFRRFSWPRQSFAMAMKKFRLRHEKRENRLSFCLITVR